jgi:hypothetical protein
MKHTLRFAALAAVLSLAAASTLAAQPATGQGPSSGLRGPAANGGRSPVRPQEIPPTVRDSGLVRVVSDDDAEATREKLRAILRQHSPSLADVLRLDPSLLMSDAYLAPYPDVAAFLAQHPEVAHNPGFFVGTSRTEWNQSPSSTGRDGILAVQDIMEGFLVLTGLVSFMTLIGWSIKKLVDHRRWLRMSKIQTDAHSKVFDRLSSNEDLLAYIQSPAGQKFLESAPLPIEGPHSIAAPIGRILFTAQLGTVITFVGFALVFANRRLAGSVPDYYQAEPFFLTASVLAIAIGVGFLASAGVAYLLSRRLGLLDAPTSSHA